MNHGFLVRQITFQKKQLAALCAFALLLFQPAILRADENKNVRPLDSGWEFYQGSLGSTWEIWRGDKAADNVTWTPVTLPHCFNARDSVDPEVRYYQGPGWYRTKIKIENPFPNGRTLLHFDGAGQKSQVFIGLKKVGEHLGGYDQWTVDITDAAKDFTNEVPVAVLCDNSRDSESIPSDLSDFNRYGGLYRHVQLIYAPAISLERIHAEPTLAADGKASVKIHARLFNPVALKDEVELTLEARDPQGKAIQTATKKLAPWSGEKEIVAFEIASPKLWSPRSPALYRCTITLKSPHGEQQVVEKFGVRSFEWVEHGPFKLNGERLLLRGTHYHEDHAGVAAASVASDGIETQFLNVTNAPSAAPKLALDVAAIDRERILKAATAALNIESLTITKFRAKLSEGGSNDFYSNGDYWWPDPSKTNGLPYIQRDGESNPDNFSQHRLVIRDLRDSVAALGAAYKLTSDDKYVSKAAELLRVFFLDEKTRMNPNLQFAQAVPGKSPGRGIGIIDALHLVEIPSAVVAMQKSSAFPPEVLAGLKKWFGELADWMLTSKNGQEEAAAKNNHSVAFYVQLAAYAKFTGDETKLAQCRKQFKEVFVPNQMALDGGFPAELKRTKPYGYSIFQLDNMTTLCQLLSTPEENLWQFELSDGRGIRKAEEFLYPFLADKSKWTLKPDIQAWDAWPSRQSNLLFAGLAFGEAKYLELWQKLSPDPTDAEVRRNIAITQPLLWVN